MKKCIAYAFEMTFKHFGHLRDLFYRGHFDAFKPKLDVGSVSQKIPISAELRVSWVRQANSALRFD